MDLYPASEGPVGVGVGVDVLDDDDDILDVVDVAVLDVVDEDDAVVLLRNSTQFPERHLPTPQKASPVPQVPFSPQQSPQTPAHFLKPCWKPHVPSVLQVLSPGQAPS